MNYSCNQSKSFDYLNLFGITNIVYNNIVYFFILNLTEVQFIKIAIFYSFWQKKKIISH